MNLLDKTVVFLSLPRHDGSYSSTPWQLAKEMAKTNHVIFIDNPYTGWDALKGIRNKAVRKRWRAYRGAISKWVEGVEVVWAPFVWPINSLPKGRLYDTMSRWNQKILAVRINRFLQQRGIFSYAFVNSFDFYFPEIQNFLRPRPSLVVYHCIDPMVKGYTLRHGPRLQHQAADRSDVVISTAPALYRQFAWKSPNNYLVPNGANAQLFSEALNRKLTIHPLVKNLTGRVMGYIGNIERRTDFDLIFHVLDRLPDWQLVMAGPTDKQFVPGKALTHPRILWLGSIPQKEVPAILKRIDVAIIPFKCDSVSEGIYPLKMFEYLAAGKPVVSTLFNPEVLLSMADVIGVARAAESFANRILEEYAQDSEERSRTRVQIAYENTWEKRAALFSEIIHAEWIEKVWT